MKRFGIQVGFVAVALAATSPTLVHAQALSVHGQVRPRTEVRDLGGDSERQSFTSMRVRADFLAEMERGVSVFVQFQDVRLWGEESSTLGDFNADNLDLHQGYVRVALGDQERLTATLGRQETNLGGQRLVGAVGWTPQGRSFDGLRVRTEEAWGSLDLLAYKLQEGDLGSGPDADLLGLYGVIDVNAENQVDLYGLYNAVSGPFETDQYTMGARLHGSMEGVTYRGEASVQRGQRNGEDVAALMLGARVGRSFNSGRGAVAIWYDYLSGDDAPDDGKVRVFDTLFATNHKFYGFADLFLNIPAHTNGLGLRDAAIKAGYDVGRSTRLAADLHHFTLDKAGPLQSKNLGQELDLSLTYGYTSNLGLTAGHSIVFATETLEQIGRAGGTVHFGYVMLNATF